MKKCCSKLAHSKEKCVYVKYYYYYYYCYYYYYY